MIVANVVGICVPISVSQRVGGEILIGNEQALQCHVMNVVGRYMMMCLYRPASMMHKFLIYNCVVLCPGRF